MRPTRRQHDQPFFRAFFFGELALHVQRALCHPQVLPQAGRRPGSIFLELSLSMRAPTESIKSNLYRGHLPNPNPKQFNLKGAPNMAFALFLTQLRKPISPKDAQERLPWSAPCLASVKVLAPIPVSFMSASLQTDVPKKVYFIVHRSRVPPAAI